jgi:hypothetical protein
MNRARRSLVVAGLVAVASATLIAAQSTSKMNEEYAMSSVVPSGEALTPRIVKAEGEQPLFAPGDRVRVTTRFPVGHYRVPSYLRGRRGSVEKVIEPAAIDNE